MPTIIQQLMPIWQEISPKRISPTFPYIGHLGAEFLAQALGSFSGSQAWPLVGPTLLHREGSTGCLASARRGQPSWVGK